MQNPATEALTRAVNRAIEGGAPVVTEVPALPAAALAMIADGHRWTIANALRAAADKWDAPDDRHPDGYAQTVANAGIAAQFKRQAAEARALADQFENC